MLEANHDVRMLQEGPYPPLKQRVLSSRGIWPTASRWSSPDVSPRGGCAAWCWAHLSEINNLPELVLQEARRRLPSLEALQVLLADQQRVGPLLEIVP